MWMIEADSVTIPHWPAEANRLAARSKEIFVAGRGTVPLFFFGRLMPTMLSDEGWGWLAWEGDRTLALSEARMMRKVFDWLMRDWRRFSIEVHEADPRAIRFARFLGFKQTGHVAERLIYRRH